MGGIIKGIGDAVTQPFKSGWNIVSGRGNIGDLFNVASVFAPGGNIASGLALKNFGTASILGATGLGALANPAKAGTMDWVNLASNFAQSGQAGGNQGTSGSTNMNPYQTQTSEIGAGIQRQISPLVARQITDYARNYPRAQAVREQGSKLVGTRNIPGMINMFASGALARGARTGQTRARQLRGMGASEAAQAGAALGSENQATEATNNYAASMYTPSNLANMTREEAALLMPDLQSLELLQLASGLANNIDPREMAQFQSNLRQNEINSQKPSFLESILGIGSQVLPYVLPTNKPRAIGPPARTSSYGGAKNNLMTLMGAS